MFLCGSFAFTETPQKWNPRIANLVCIPQTRFFIFTDCISSFHDITSLEMLFSSYLDISIARDVTRGKGKTILFHAFSVHFRQQKRPIAPRHRPFIPVLCRVYSVFSGPGRVSKPISWANLSTRFRSMATFDGYPAALQRFSIQFFSSGGMSKTNLAFAVMVSSSFDSHGIT